MKKIEKVFQASPVVIYCGSAMTALISQEKIAVYFFIGVILFGGILNVFLKNIIFKPILSSKIGERPINSPEHGCGNFDEECSKKIEKTYGFPSGHSQLIAFSAMFWSLYLLDKNKKNKKNKKILNIITIFILWFLAITIACSRFYINCHTIPQIITGFTIGVLLGYLYYRIVKNKI